jgi:NAD dependent epimerase/dehydratase family enzyme
VSLVAVTGSSGLIGTPLVAALRERGDEVLRLVRRPARHDDEVRWDPAGRHLDPAVLDGVDAVVNLAGAGVGDHRWTPSYKHEILSSRVDSTHAVATAIAGTGRPVRLVSGSAVGYYGDRGEELLTEDSPAGTGFLAEVVLAWEAAARPAVDAGAPTAFIRTGLVLSRPGETAGPLLRLDRSGMLVSTDGGAAGPLLRLARLGLGGPLGWGGWGRQFWPWITLPDQVGAILHLLDHPEVTGPVNLVGPRPARQRDVARELGRAAHRPAVLPAPGFAARIALGEFAGDILASQRVLPGVLDRSGFSHQYDTLTSAVRWLVG